MKINILPFSKVLSDSTKKFIKIKKQDYLEYGKYPIVDQGKNFICGYTDNKELVNFEDIPVIVFGDHTKVFKYIDFPIAIGADGVKVLTVNPSKYDTKYIYYYLKSLHLADGGYSRHFKYLKAKKINFPEDKDDQIKIANLLTQVESLIAKREESIKLLDELLRSTFLDMFGDPINNPKGFETVDLQSVCLDKGEYGSGASAVEYDKSLPRYLRITDINSDGSLSKDKKSPDLIEAKYVLEFGDMLFARTGATVGKTYLHTSEEFLQFAGYLIRFKPNFELINPYYLFHYTQSGYYHYWVSKKQRAAGQPNINAKEYGSLKLLKPPKTLQDKFATIVQQVEETKKSYNKSLDELHQLFGSLSQRAFKGELDLSGMEILLDIHDIDTIASNFKGSDSVAYHIFLETKKLGREIIGFHSDLKKYNRKLLDDAIKISRKQSEEIRIKLYPHLQHIKIPYTNKFSSNRSLNYSEWSKSQKELEEKLDEIKTQIYKLLENIPQIKNAITADILNKDDFVGVPLKYNYEYSEIKRIIMDKLASNEIAQKFDEESKSMKLVKAR